MKILIVTDIETKFSDEYTFTKQMQDALTAQNTECLTTSYDDDYGLLIESVGYDLIIADVSIISKGDTAINGLLQSAGDIPVITYGYEQVTGDVRSAEKSKRALAFHDASCGTAPIIKHAIETINSSQPHKPYSPNAPRP